jgi:hypothetical protein
MNAARLLVCFLAWIAATSSHAQSLTQDMELRPGWNAIWLEVEAPDRSPASVFAGLPVQSVWTWSDRVSATDFIQNPGDAGWNRAQWLSYFPEGSPEAVLSNLRAVLPQRAYLVKLGGDQPVRWSIRGRPILRTPKWAADAYNLRGFPVDSEAPPTFKSFFRPSAAHYAPATGLESIFTLGPDGQWSQVSPEATLQRGIAYWVYTRGPSDYIAPFHLELNTGDVVDFDATQGRVNLTLHNRHALSKGIRIEHQVTNGTHLVLIPSPISSATNSIRPLETYTQTVAAATSHRLTLGLDRTKLPTTGSDPANPSLHTSLLAISDGEGTSFHVGASAIAGTAADYTGLWVGKVTVTNVSPTLVATNVPGAPGEVTAGFPLQLLLHVDQDGQTSLLRDVTLVYSRSGQTLGTNQPAWSPPRATELVTDPARLVTYSASDIRSGAVRGRRLTSPHFDFARTNGQFTQSLSGVFASNNTITGTLLLTADTPTNPFRHRYHPDHGTNAFAVERDITLQLQGNSSLDPGEGDLVLGGAYSETITGLHRQPLYTSGALELRRISDLGRLNANNP